MIGRGIAYFQFMLSSFLFSTVIICSFGLLYLSMSAKIDRNSGTYRFGKKESGKVLYQELLKINRSQLSKGQTIELTRYKFFTELLDELLVNYRQTGANIFNHIGELRKNLLKDIKYEKKLAGARNSSLVEMGMIFGMSGLFSIFATSYAEINIPTSSLVLAFSWQLTGTFVFLYSMKVLRQKHFKPFHKYLRAASFLDIFIKTGRPVNVIAKRIELSSLDKDKSLLHLEERMELILEQIKSHGIYDQSQGEELGAECWYCYEEKLEHFFQEIKRLKLSVVTLFFLGSYLFIFFSLVGALQQGH